MMQRGYQLDCAVIASSADGALAEAIKPKEERMTVESSGGNNDNAEREKLRQNTKINQLKLLIFFLGSDHQTGPDFNSLNR